MLRMDGALHVVLCATSAHPSCWLAAREHQSNVYCLLDRCRAHSVNHGKERASSPSFHWVKKGGLQGRRRVKGRFVGSSVLASLKNSDFRMARRFPSGVEM